MGVARSVSAVAGPCVARAAPALESRDHAPAGRGRGSGTRPFALVIDPVVGTDDGGGDTGTFASRPSKPSRGTGRGGVGMLPLEPRAASLGARTAALPSVRVG